MRANLLTAALSAVAALAMNSVYSGSIFGAGLWLGLHVPAFIGHLLWQDFSCVLAAVHAWNGLAAAMFLMTVVFSLSRK
ncbi:MAG TPA: hypothetical protein VKS44_11490 [Candidatus Acidoferrales bacterium]|nr:hypothetical protein [Candidatus Acidoferrales bacterium]